MGKGTKSTMAVNKTSPSRVASGLTIGKSKEHLGVLGFHCFVCMLVVWEINQAFQILTLLNLHVYLWKSSMSSRFRPPLILTFRHQLFLCQRHPLQVVLAVLGSGCLDQLHWPLSVFSLKGVGKWGPLGSLF